jgi:hypothetical protein
MACGLLLSACSSNPASGSDQGDTAWLNGEDAAGTGDVEEPTDANGMTGEDGQVQPEDDAEGGESDAVADTGGESDTGSSDTSPDEQVPCCVVGQCRMLTRQQCNMAQGTVKSGDSCEEVQCDSGSDKQPCCVRGQCSMLSQQECLTQKGEQKEGADCGSVSCPTTQPCCIENQLGTACIVASQSRCDEASGTLKSGASQCSEVQCGGQQMSACCLSGLGESSCVHTTKDNCDTFGGDFNEGQECTDVSC